MPVTRSLLSVIGISLAFVPGLASAQSILDVSAYGATSSYGDTMRKSQVRAAPTQAKHVALSSKQTPKFSKSAKPVSAKSTAKKTRHK